MSERHSILHEKTIEFFRAEVDRRYQISYLRSVPSIYEEGLLNGVDQETIDRAKVFFREVLYPSSENRSLRDESVEKVMDILGNRGRILSLLPKMPRFFLKYGPALVTAAEAGLEVLSTFRLSTRIEKEVVEHLDELCEEEGIDIDSDAPDTSVRIPERLMQRAFVLVPQHRVEKMTEHLRKLTRRGMQRGTIDATEDVLKELHRGVETRQEKQAIDYALWVLDRLDEEVKAHSREMMERLLEIAERVEHYYLEELSNLYSRD